MCNSVKTEVNGVGCSLPPSNSELEIQSGVTVSSPDNDYF